jgi:hypothetical protein
MANDETKRKWFEDVTIQPTMSHARTKPVAVEKIKKRTRTGDNQQATEPKERRDTGRSTKVR